MSSELESQSFTEKWPVLLVEDDEDQAMLLRRQLEGSGHLEFVITVCGDLKSALELIESRAFRCVLLDLALPDSFGVGTVREVRDHSEKIPIVVITTSNDVPLGLQALQAGAQDFLIKGKTYDYQLRNAIMYASERQSIRDALEQKNRYLEKAIDELKTLRGIIPICASCHSIRTDEGAWQALEMYMRQHTEAEFSHGLCPECLKKVDV